MLPANDRLPKEREVERADRACRQAERGASALEGTARHPAGYCDDPFGDGDEGNRQEEVDRQVGQLAAEPARMVNAEEENVDGQGTGGERRPPVDETAAGDRRCGFVSQRPRDREIGEPLDRRVVVSKKGALSGQEARAHGAGEPDRSRPW